METKIKEVQQYFKDKLINGDYTPVEFEVNYVTVQIDEKYGFAIWTGSGEKYCKMWEHSAKFMDLPEFTESEKVLVWANISKVIEENAERIRIEKIEKLELELNKLKGESI